MVSGLPGARVGCRGQEDGGRAQPGPEMTLDTDVAETRRGSEQRTCRTCEGRGVQKAGDQLSTDGRGRRPTEGGGHTHAISPPGAERNPRLHRATEERGGGQRARPSAPWPAAATIRATWRTMRPATLPTPNPSLTCPGRAGGPEGEGRAPLAQVVPRPRSLWGSGSSRVEGLTLFVSWGVWELGLAGVLGGEEHAGWGDRKGRCVWGSLALPGGASSAQAKQV